MNKQPERNITLLAYPNPVVDELRVSIPNNWQNKKVIYEVLNANGQLADKVEIASSSQTETIYTANLLPGVYFLRASCGKEAAQQKIVKQ
jgi:hypothetical protein